jgi:protein-tyrosine-phosphatase
MDMLYLTWAQRDMTTKKNSSLLFVCTANICRSPMAEALFRARLQNKQTAGQNWRVESAGTWAEDGHSASDGSCEVMRRRGIDLSEHKSKTVSRELLSQFDLILTMEAGHKEALQIEFPELADRVFLLSEMLGLQVPVRDPYGGPLTAYEVTADTIESMITKGMNRIIAMVEARRAKA